MPIFSSATIVFGPAVVHVDDLSVGIARDTVAIECTEGALLAESLSVAIGASSRERFLTIGPFDRESAEPASRDS